MQLREAFLFRLECAEPAYLWSGAGDLVIDGDTYLGGGELLDGLPQIAYLINGTADSVTFTASGVDPETIRLAHEDRNQVNGAPVRIGTVSMDERWQVAGPVDWEWEGVASVVTVDRSGSEDGGVTRSISLLVESGDTARSRSQLNFFSDADQRKRSATDAIFSHTAGIAQGNTRRFAGR